MRPTALAVATGFALAVLPGVAHADSRPTSVAAERFLLVLAGVPGSSGTVIATGAITDTGTITPADGDVETFTFPDGTLRLTTSTTTQVELPRPPLCVTRFTSTGTWQVLDGTGRFAGASGSGRSTDSGATIGPALDGACTDQPTFLVAAAHLAGTLRSADSGTR